MENLVIEKDIVKNGKKCKGEIRIPDGVVEIANQAFYQNKEITGLYIPDGVKKIGKYTVNCCEKLEYIRVPESVEVIGESGLVKNLRATAPSIILLTARKSILKSVAKRIPMLTDCLRSFLKQRIKWQVTL